MDITVRSATLVRSALAGAVVCLVAVGVTAPALAGSGDDPEPCPDAGPVEALLNGEDCGEDAPAPVLAPGSLLDPQFPDFPDFPGLPDDDSDEQDDESGSDDDGDEGDESEAADEDADSDSDTESDTESGTGSDEDSDETDSDKTDSDEADSSADEDAEPAVFTDEPAARDSGADAAVGAAVLPGVGDAIDGADSPGLDWTGALAPGGPSGPDGPRDPPAPAQRVDPPAPRTYLAAPLAPPPAPAHAAEPAAVAFATALPSPVDARWDLGSVLPSLALTLLLLGALALPVGPLNRAAAEHPERLEALLARLRVPPGTGRPAPVAFLTAVGVTAVAGAVLLGFLTPEFPFDTSAPALLVGLAVAFIVVTAAQQGTQLLYVTRWWGVRCHLGPVPGFLLLGAVAVVLSRAVGLEPGLVIGTLVAFRTARALRTDEEGPAVALAATALTAVGGTAWVVRDPLVAAAGEPGTFLADVVATALTATAVSAAANLLFALVPLAFLPGAALLRWSPALWALFACTGGFAFVHLAVPPPAGGTAGQAGVLAVLLGVYLLGAAALWTWLRYGVDWTASRLSPAPRR